MGRYKDRLVLVDADPQAGEEIAKGLDYGEEVLAGWHNDEPVIQIWI